MLLNETIAQYSAFNTVYSCLKEFQSFILEFIMVMGCDIFEGKPQLCFRCNTIDVTVG